MGLKERFVQFLDYKGIKKATFEKSVGFSNGFVDKMGDNTRQSKIEVISNFFPELNIVWLLTGEGDMLINEEQLAAPTQDTKPHLPIAVIAGRMGGISEAVRLHECEQLPVVYAFPRYDYTMMVQGDSMEPKYEGGDRIAIRKVCDYVEWGKTYVVDTADGALLKRIYDEGDTIRCVSFNKDYPDFHVNKQNIYGLYKVVGLLRINQ